jgi:hypothetical protein
MYMGRIAAIEATRGQWTRRKVPACNVPWTVKVYQRLPKELNIAGVAHARLPEKGLTGGGICILTCGLSSGWASRVKERVTTPQVNAADLLNDHHVERQDTKQGRRISNGWRDQRYVHPRP